MKTSIKIFLICCAVCLCGCKEELVQNIDESRAHRVISELYAFGINATKSKHGEGQWAIEVERSELTRAIAILTSRKLMPEGKSEEPSQPGLMDSKEDRQFAYQRKMGGSLEKTLETFPGVLRARVHIFLPPAADFLSSISQTVTTDTDNTKGRNGSASIVLLTDEGAGVTYEQVSSIVAGATGIAKDGVTVVFETVAPLVHPTVLPAATTEATLAVQSTSNLPRDVVTPSELIEPVGVSKAGSGTLLWGTVAYLLGIATLLSSLALVIIKRQKTVSIGQRILYEQS